MSNKKNKIRNILVFSAFLVFRNIYGDEDLLKVFGILENPDSTVLLVDNGAEFFRTDETLNRIEVIDSAMKQSRPFEGFFILHIGACDSGIFSKARERLSKVDLLEMMCYEDIRKKSIIRPIYFQTKLKFTEFDLRRLQSMRTQLDSISKIPGWVKSQRQNYILPSELDRRIKEELRRKDKSAPHSH
jgi:hypothetical protein